MEKWRADIRRLARRALIAASAGGAIAAVPALACELPPGTRIESPRLALSYRTVPARIAVGQPFVLELAACPIGGARLPESVKLDAQMPEHRHGMNYRTRVVATAPGRFHSEGWLFHMPGRWEFLFDIGTERLTHSVRIE